MSLVEANIDTCLTTLAAINVNFGIRLQLQKIHLRCTIRVDAISWHVFHGNSIQWHSDSLRRVYFSK